MRHAAPLWLSAALPRLQGRVALVTGAGFGIGRGIARPFAREGAVTVAEINLPAGERTAGEVDALGGRGLGATDVADEDQCRAAVDGTVGRFGRVDVLAWTMRAPRAAGPSLPVLSERGECAHVRSRVQQAASRALARSAARKWARLGIRVNVICPAAVTEAYEAF